MEAKKLNTILAVAAVALLVATSAFAALYVDANNKIAQQNEDIDRYTMLGSMNYPLLNQGQASAQTKLMDVVKKTEELGNALRVLGLNSTMARRSMSAAASSSPYIVDLLTMGMDGVIQAAQPSQYSYMEGQDFSGDAWVQNNLFRGLENMSNVFFAEEGVYGASLMVPVFDNAHALAGSLLTLIDVQAIVDDSLAVTAANLTCSYDCMQKDGFIIASSSPAELHLNAFTSPEFANYTQLRALNWRVVNETAGYGEYQFPKTLGGTTMFTKDMFWVSFGFRGLEWRLMVQHAQ
jgi:hypothetical protein